MARFGRARFGRARSGIATLVLAVVTTTLLQPTADAATRRRTRTTTASASADTTPAVPTTVPPLDGDPCAVRLLPLGDSLTSYPDSYRGPLQRLLAAQKLRVDVVGSGVWPPTGGGDEEHEGHGGFTIGPDDKIDTDGRPGNLFQRVDEWIPNAKPDVILLQVGTNDLAAGIEPAAKAPERIKGLIAKVHQLAPDAWLIVGTLTPTSYWGTRGTPESDALNAAVRAAGDADPGDRIITADLWSRLRAQAYMPSTSTSDGIHPNLAGGERIAKAWMPWVLPAVERKARNRCTK